MSERLVGYALKGDYRNIVNALLKMTPLEAALAMLNLYDQLPDMTKVWLKLTLEEGTKSFFVVDINGNIEFKYDNEPDARLKVHEYNQTVVPGGTK